MGKAFDLLTASISHSFSILVEIVVVPHFKNVVSAGRTAGENIYLVTSYSVNCSCWAVIFRF